MANQLRIESANGAPIADYRVFEGYVEVRALSFSRLISLRPVADGSG